MIGHFLLRIIIWFLLTANFELPNIIIGIIVALSLPYIPLFKSTDKIQDLLKSLWQIAIAIPQAYLEAFQLILHPHRQEEIVIERIKSERSPRLVFLDIFLITLTPKTVVLKYNEQGWYEVHRVRRKKK
ncbi:Na+/H+ antiporter subunit E [Synechococcus elongatus]|uniref:Na+/H+ antiporter subunit E n=2 Tax=Synechococcus elongatus TaxID=32046 RepID=A0AAN1UUT9_SYNEL|nr:Na+/H+ antiporter subunit E [Synechococcus elongatus]AZB72920.1 cation:proton antiporter [Synechococcus elongatus PCC 11801]QFZ92797.1 cation:proton antiporter [Synechococcus elongatus PCC 11802]